MGIGVKSVYQNLQGVFFSPIQCLPTLKITDGLIPHYQTGEPFILRKSRKCYSRLPPVLWLKIPSKVAQLRFLLVMHFRTYFDNVLLLSFIVEELCRH